MKCGYPSDIALICQYLQVNKSIITNHWVTLQAHIRHFSTNCSICQSHWSPLRKRTCKLTVTSSQQLSIIACYCRNGSLTWHNNIIPKDEIWVKIGGDKGGTSFKMCFQIANVHHPNSKNNTVVFLCYEGDDSTVNLHRVFPLVKEQLAELQKQTWRYSGFLIIHVHRKPIQKYTLSVTYHL